MLKRAEPNVTELERVKRERDEARAALARLVNATSDMLRGVEIHNERVADRGAKATRIAGEVVRNLDLARDAARALLAPAPDAGEATPDA